MILFQPKPSEYEAALEYARSMGFGFELTDFMFCPVLDDPETCAKLLRRFDGAPVKVFHGPFADLNFSGGDPEIQAVTGKRIRQCCEYAAELGVRKMVLHSCFFPLMPPGDMLYEIWSENSVEMLSELAERYSMTFCLENLLDITPEILCGILRAANGNPRLRACLDAGHANLSRTPQKEWNDALSPWLSHFHLSDNGGTYDDHIAVGSGTVDWNAFFASLNPLGGDVDYTLEVNGLARVMASADWLSAHGYLERLRAETKA